MITNKSEIQLLKAFYSHDLSLAPSENNNELAELLLRVLSKHSCRDILDLIRQSFVPFKLEKKDIPQFSDLKDCYITVPHVLINCGLDGVSYQQMGYMLRETRRKIVADRKYGENHMKTAKQLGLCIINKYKAYPSILTRPFDGLGNNEKESLLPKLCLHIEMLQNFFVSNGNDETLEEILSSTLTGTTIVRRRGNCRTLISVLSRELEHEF